MTPKQFRIFCWYEFIVLIVGTIIKQLCSFGDGWQVGIDIATIITNLMGLLRYLPQKQKYQGLKN